MQRNEYDPATRYKSVVGVNENISFLLRKMLQRFATGVTCIRELDFIRVLCRIVILMRCKAGLFSVNIEVRMRYLRMSQKFHCCIFATANVNR